MQRAVMTNDIVAELDYWLAEPNRKLWGLDRQRVKRARDEIVALREKLEITGRHLDGAYNHRLPEVRADALEQAARVIEAWETMDVWRSEGAAAIRALKDKPS
jgi:hypothetical protein